MAFADGHTASNSPDLVRRPKLSGAGPGQYWGGRPPRKPFGVLSAFVYSSPFALLCIAVFACGRLVKRNGETPVRARSGPKPPLYGHWNVGPPAPMHRQIFGSKRFVSCEISSTLFVSFGHARTNPTHCIPRQQSTTQHDTSRRIVIVGPRPPHKNCKNDLDDQT